MADISQKTLAVIQHEHLEPISRRHLLIKWVALWALVILCLLVGSSIFSVLFFGLMDNDWSVFLGLGKSFDDHLVANLPFLWLVCALLMVLIASFVLRATKQGYHYKKRWLILISLALSVFLGFLFQLANWGDAIDSIIYNHVPEYASIPQREMDIWLKPEHGLLTGSIVSIDGNNLTLMDPLNKIWTVDLNNSDEAAEIKDSGCTRVKIIGAETSDNTFVVKEIYPWISKFYSCLSAVK